MTVNNELGVEFVTETDGIQILSCHVQCLRTAVHKSVPFRFDDPTDSSSSANYAAQAIRMKRIAYHPHIHPAQPWCVFETEFADVERLPKIALFATREEAQLTYPDASVDSEFAWECQLRIAP